MTRRASTRSSPTQRDWPGERFGHRSLLDPRGDVRARDGVYVALAEALGATLLTLDRRLAGMRSRDCEVEVPEPSRQP